VTGNSGEVLAWLWIGVKSLALVVIAYVALAEARRYRRRLIEGRRGDDEGPGPEETPEDAKAPENGKTPSPSSGPDAEA